MTFELAAKTRSLKGKKVHDLRLSGKVPGVVYGPGRENHLIEIDRSVLEKAYEKAGTSTIIKLGIDDDATTYNVLLYDVSSDPMSRELSHVDFYCFQEGQKLNAVIPLRFIGEPATIKDHGAVLVKQFEELSVYCLPESLVSEIVVDLSVIKKMDDMIKIKDLALPAGIEIEHEVDEIVASTVLTSVEEEKVLTPAETALPVVEKKGKQLEEGAEGAKESK